MTDTKTCTKCGKVFGKPEEMSLASWGIRRRCDTCGKKDHPERSTNSKAPVTTLGKYEVKNEIIDRFLYG